MGVLEVIATVEGFNLVLLYIVWKHFNSRMNRQSDQIKSGDSSDSGFDSRLKVIESNYVDHETLNRVISEQTRRICDTLSKNVQESEQRQEKKTGELARSIDGMRNEIIKVIREGK